MIRLPIIKNNGISLVQPELSRDNLNIYRKWLDDPRVVKGIGDSKISSLEEIFYILNNWKRDNSKQHWFIYLNKEDDEKIPVGDLNIDIIPRWDENYEEFEIDDEFSLIKNKAEIKIMIEGDYQKKGIGGKVINSAIQHSKRIKLDSIYASIYKDNLGSIALFIKNNFQKVGCFIEEGTNKEEEIFRLKLVY